MLGNAYKIGTTTTTSIDVGHNTLESRTALGKQQSQHYHTLIEGWIHPWLVISLSTLNLEKYQQPPTSQPKKKNEALNWIYVCISGCRLLLVQLMLYAASLSIHMLSTLICIKVLVFRAFCGCAAAAATATTAALAY